MAVTFQIADILADVAYRANVPEFSATTRTTLTQANRLVAQSARSFSERCAQEFGSSHDYLMTTPLTVGASVGLTSMPTNTSQIHQIVWCRSSTEYLPLDQMQPEDLALAAPGDLAPWVEPPKYRLEGETIVFYPPSSINESILVYHTRHLDITGETEFAARVDSDLWVTYTVVIAILDSEGRDSSKYELKLAQLESKLFAKNRERDATATHTIRNVRSRPMRRWPY